ncbi:MAG: hypothetical protein KKF78_02145, partial [Candidatus Omnitrophica bacterium]|nr:hypothetical protein [Candidatus Omnitrophota bacterium]
VKVNIRQALIEHAEAIRGQNIYQIMNIIGCSGQGLRDFLRENPEEEIAFGIVRDEEPEAYIENALEEHAREIKGRTVGEVAVIIDSSSSGLHGYLERHPEAITRYGMINIGADRTNSNYYIPAQRQHRIDRESKQNTDSEREQDKRSKGYYGDVTEQDLNVFLSNITAGVWSLELIKAFNSFNTQVEGMEVEFYVLDYGANAPPANSPYIFAIEKNGKLYVIFSPNARSTIANAITSAFNNVEEKMETALKIIAIHEYKEVVEGKTHDQADQETREEFEEDHFDLISLFDAVFENYDDAIEAEYEEVLGIGAGAYVYHVFTEDEAVEGINEPKVPIEGAVVKGIRGLNGATLEANNGAVYTLILSGVNWLRGSLWKFKFKIIEPGAVYPVEDPIGFQGTVDEELVLIQDLDRRLMDLRATPEVGDRLLGLGLGAAFLKKIASLTEGLAVEGKIANEPTLERISKALNRSEIKNGVDLKRVFLGSVLGQSALGAGYESRNITMLYCRDFDRGARIPLEDDDAARQLIIDWNNARYNPIGYRLVSTVESKEKKRGSQARGYYGDVTEQDLNNYLAKISKGEWRLELVEEFNNFNTQVEGMDVEFSVLDYGTNAPPINKPYIFAIEKEGKLQVIFSPNLSKRLIERIKNKFQEQPLEKLQTTLLLIGKHEYKEVVEGKSHDQADQEIREEFIREQAELFEFVDDMVSEVLIEEGHKVVEIPGNYGVAIERRVYDQRANLQAVLIPNLTDGKPVTLTGTDNKKPCAILFEGNQTLKIFINNDFAGVVIFEVGIETIYVEYIHVNKEYWDSGAGTTVLNWIIKEAKARGFNVCNSGIIGIRVPNVLRKLLVNAKVKLFTDQKTVVDIEDADFLNREYLVAKEAVSKALRVRVLNGKTIFVVETEEETEKLKLWDDLWLVVSERGYLTVVNSFDEEQKSYIAYANGGIAWIEGDPNPIYVDINQEGAVIQWQEITQTEKTHVNSTVVTDAVTEELIAQDNSLTIVPVYKDLDLSGIKTIGSIVLTNQQKRLYGKNKEHILNAVIFFIKSIKILKIQTVRIAGPLVLGRYYGFNAVELINKLWAHIAGVEPQSNDYILGLTPQAIHENMSESGGVLAGGAIRKSKAAVVSMSHIDATSLETFIPVLQRLSLHEVGHLFELSHCPNACVMSKISYMFEYNTFCPTCEALINKRKTLQGLERASMQKATTYGSPFKFIESMSKEVLDVGVNVIKKGKTVVVKFSSELNKSYQDALVALINYSVALSGASKTKYAVRTKNVFLRDDISIRVAEFNDQYCRGYGENSVACVSEDGKVLYINFEVLQVIASLKTVAQREDFMTFIHGQIEGHEVFHIDEIQRTGKTSEENVLKRNILYLENDQVVLKATCNVINDPKVYGIRADFEMSERLNDLEREYYSNQGRSIAARMFSKGILSAEDLSISEKTVNRLIIWKAAAEVIGAAWLLLADMEKVPTALHDEIILKLGERTYEFIERYKELKKIVYSPRIKGGKVVGRKTIENYIKLFVVTAKYYEVIVLRFARMTELLSTLKMDTTDNRQYARYLSLKARHVDSIIAEFLLLRRAASVLKSKSLIVLDPEEYERIDKEIVEEVGFETREEGERYLDRVSDAVKAYLLGNDQIRCNIPEEVINEISLVDIRTRLKSVYSYANKERRIREKAVKSQGSVGTIDDILGLMIVVESEDDVHAAHALLQDIQKELGWLKYNRLSRDLQYKDPKVWGKYAGYHTALKDEDGRNIEVVLFDRENYEKYLLGTSAHWEYAAQKDEKELADQSFKDLMEIEMTGDLKKDFQAALDQFAKEVIVVAVIEIQKDHYVYIPVSLGEGATLFDLAAHPLVDVVNGSQYYGAYYVEVGEERGEVVVDKAGINVARRIKSKDQIQTGTTILFPLKAKDSIKLRIRHTENSITNRARLISSMLPLPEAGKKSLMTSGKEKVWKNKYLLKQKEKNYSEFLMLLVDVNDYKDLEDLYKAYSIGFVTDETIRDFALQLGRVRLEGTLDYERSRHLSEADLFIISQEYILTAYYLPFAYVNDLLNSDDAFLIALGMNQIDINDIGKKLSSSKAGIVSQYDEVLGVADITFIFQSIRPGRLYSVVRLASQYGNIKNVLVKVVRDLKTNKGKYKVDITIEGISKTKNEELLRAANSILDASSKETYVWQDKAR